jgi:hypothetical protein
MRNCSSHAIPHKHQRSVLAGLLSLAAALPQEEETNSLAYSQSQDESVREHHRPPSAFTLADSNTCLTTNPTFPALPQQLPIPKRSHSFSYAPKLQPTGKEKQGLFSRMKLMLTSSSQGKVGPKRVLSGQEPALQKDRYSSGGEKGRGESRGNDSRPWLPEW